MLDCVKNAVGIILRIDEGGENQLVFLEVRLEVRLFQLRDQLVIKQTAIRNGIRQTAASRNDLQMLFECVVKIRNCVRHFVLLAV